MSDQRMGQKASPSLATLLFSSSGHYIRKVPGSFIGFTICISNNHRLSEIFLSVAVYCELA